MVKPLYWWPSTTITKYAWCGPLIPSTWEPKDLDLVNRTWNPWVCLLINLVSKNISQEVRSPRYYDLLQRKCIWTTGQMNWAVSSYIRAKSGPSYSWTKLEWVQHSWHLVYAGWEIPISCICEIHPYCNISTITPSNRNPMSSWNYLVATKTYYSTLSQ